MIEEQNNKERPQDRDERIRKIIDKCRQRLASGDGFPDAVVIDRFRDLMPELGQELKKLRMIEDARRRAFQDARLESVSPEQLEPDPIPIDRIIDRGEQPAAEPVPMSKIVARGESEIAPIPPVAKIVVQRPLRPTVKVINGMRPGKKQNPALVMGVTAAGVGILLLTTIVLLWSAGRDGPERTDAGDNTPSHPAPKLLSIPSCIVDEGESSRLTVPVANADPNVRLSLSVGYPAGMTLDERTGEIAWTPTEEQGPGNYTISVQLVGSGMTSQSDVTTFSVEVRETNDAPTIEPIPDQQIDPGRELRFQVKATDADRPSNRLRITLSQGPSGANIDEATGEFSWTLAPEDTNQEYRIVVRVSDDGTPAQSSERSFTVRVNRPPLPLAKSITNSIGMRLVLIPAGEFLMGSPDSEANRGDKEYQHRVRITEPFYLGVYEVTEGEFERLTGIRRKFFKNVAGQDTSRFPVTMVSWHEAVEFCRKLSSLDAERSAGRSYRLPTEAEWEYACRAGTTTPFHFGNQLNGREANCHGNNPYGTRSSGPSLRRPTTVGSYAPNAFGLYDMHGNVFEWCQDWYESDYYRTSPMDDPQGPGAASYRVARVGSYGYRAGWSRSAFRYVPTYHATSAVGFRVALAPNGIPWTWCKL